jgi:Mg-chelatase subunit ChlD
MVIKFKENTQVAIDFTPVSNLAALNAAIDSAFVSPDGTRLYDSVYESINRLALRSPGNRTVAIVVSDGEDLNDKTEGQLSTHNLEDVIANAQGKGVSIFTVGLGDFLKPEIMQPMAVQTGGEFLRAPTSTDLNNAYLKISQILTNQYEITFTTLKSDGSVNSLTVGVTNGVLRGDDTVSVTY